MPYMSRDVVNIGAGSALALLDLASMGLHNF